MKFFRTFILILFSLILGQGGELGLFAQSYNFKNYSAEQGLPSLKVDAIYQDSKGYLWVGGYGGLSKFNGKQFIANYSFRDGLSNQQITSITEDNDGNIWAGTINGLSRFDGRDFSIFTKKDGLAGEHITSITKDKNGRLWIGTTEGISFYNGKSFESLTTTNGLSSNNVAMVYAGKSGTIWIITDKGPSKIIFENPPQQDKSFDNYHFASINFNKAVGKVMSVVEDDNGDTWFGTDSGAVKYDGIKLIIYDTQDGLLNNSVKAVVKDEHSNDIWIGTSNGLNKISAKGKIETFKVRGVRNGNEIGKLFVDAEGNLWLGTRNGVYRFRDPSFATYSEQDGLQDSQISFIIRDSKKNLWVGTAREGVYKYSSAALLKNGLHSAINFSQKDGLIGTFMYSCIEDKKGNIWLGTNKGVSVYDGKSFTNFKGKKMGLKTDSVFSVMQDSKGGIWLGGQHGGVILEGTKSKAFELKSDDQDLIVVYEFEDSKGNIWLGTRSGELFLYDGKSYINFSQKFNLNSKTYFAITEDKDGILYFGSFDGVYIYDPSGKNRSDNKSVLLISEQDGLSSDLIYAMSFDETNENLYIGTNQGLNKLDVKEFKKSGKIQLRKFGLEDGLSALDFNPNGIWRDDDGTFWLGTVNGLIHFNPSRFHENHIESNTSIKNIQIFYSDTLLPSDSKLPYNLNSISFEYIGICLTNPEKVYYSYKLKNYNKDWSPPTQEAIARYSNLNPGHYEFMVKSCNNEGIWNKEPASFSFEILTPWWKAWWFRVSASVVTIILILVFFKARTQAIRRNEAEKLSTEIQLANNELKALRAQMDPHFIFNSLSSIQSFIMTKDEESALRYLNKFAKLMRMILSNSEKSSVTIREEIDSLKLYLELEALRWDNKFDFIVNTDSKIEIDFHKIPSMLMQPYVENAILHGVVPKREGRGKIEITINQNETHIICTISDNGIGRIKSQELRTKSNQSSHESMGMKITSDRLEVLNRIHHSNLNVKITDMQNVAGTPTGTKVEIFIPIS